METLMRVILGGAFPIALYLGINMLFRKEESGTLYVKEGWTKFRGFLYLVIGPQVLWFIVAPSTRFAFVVLDIPVLFQVVGFILFGLGLGVRIFAQFALGAEWSEKIRLRPKHKRVHHGLYRHIQHPMYMSYIPMSLGLFGMTGDWLLGMASVLYGAMSLCRIPLENRLLSQLGKE